MSFSAHRIFFVVCFLVFNSYGDSVHKQKDIGKPDECTVFGHGPYELDFAKCVELAKSQAQTNCILKRKSANVEYVSLSYKDKTTSKKGRCLSPFDQKTKQCQPANCNSNH